MDAERAFRSSRPEGKGLREWAVEVEVQQREMRGFVGSQTGGDLGKVDVLERRNYAKVSVGGTHFQARRQGQHVVLGFQRIGLEGLGVLIEGLGLNRRSAELPDGGN